jgi:hypothetical protein
MSLTLLPVRVATVTTRRAGSSLPGIGFVAVLVQLSGEHGDLAGHWFLEAGFGRLDAPEHPTFPDLAGAETWIDRRLVETRSG